MDYSFYLCYFWFNNKILKKGGLFYFLKQIQRKWGVVFFCSNPLYNYTIKKEHRNKQVKWINRGIERRRRRRRRKQNKIVISFVVVLFFFLFIYSIWKKLFCWWLLKIQKSPNTLNFSCCFFLAKGPLYLLLLLYYVL